MQLIDLQKANGSWDLNEDLTKILGVSLEDLLAAHPAQVRFKESNGVGIFLRE